MPYNNNLITAPVSIHDVQQALGVSENDLATLCMDNNINMKSAHKPVYMSKIAPLTDNDLATGRADSIDGYFISYGIKMRRSSNVDDYIDTSALANYFPVKDAPWAYDKPVEDGTNAFRLSDFNNYWPDADWAMSLSFPTTSNIYIPQQYGESGQAINFSMNWNYNNYDNGWLSPQQLFYAIRNNYYPSILLTCFYQGGSWNYAKSAKKPNSSSYWTIGEIGASSAQSGVSVTINTADLYDTIGRTYPNSILESRKWTACWVLLSAPMAGNVEGGFKVFDVDVPSNNKTVVRLQLPTSTVNDRKTFTVVAKKKSYISSISMFVEVMKQNSTPSGSYHRWNVSKIKFTFEKETSDTISFVLKGKFSCQNGNAYAQGTPDSDGKYTINSNISVTGTGTQEVTLATEDYTLSNYAIYYDPTSPEQNSNVIRFSGTLYLENSSFGNWSGGYGIESAPSEPFGKRNSTTNMS